MKIGSIGFATSQGLGYLLKDFYDNGIVTDVLPIRHGKYKNHDWYGEAKRVSNEDMRKFCLDKDVMFFFETTFDENIISFCRANGILTVFMPMYECSPSYSGVNRPDLIISPSQLDYAHYPQGTFIPVPIPKWVEWRERTQANVFVHNAGHGGLKGRNGTRELLAAIPMIKKPFKMIIRTQEPMSIPLSVAKDPRVELITGTVPREQLYEDGDVFLFPEKFNGLSLPIQEAKAAGMAIMCLNRFPMDIWNEKELLIPTSGVEHGIAYKSVIKMDIVRAETIAGKIDEWSGKDITKYSHIGKDFHDAMQWENLKDDYTQSIVAAMMRMKSEQASIGTI